MPTDANGVHTLADGYLAVTGETILASQHNPPLEDLSESMTLRVMRTGVTPMTGPLKLADGVVGAPSAAFASAPSSGLFKTTDGIGVAIGGVMVAEFIAGGLKSGAKFIGEVFDWTGTTAPTLCVFPVGQTLSRTTYADLWAFAQIEIAAGSTLYNNGNGSTTFGVLDCRGRVRASKDNMGGSAASRLTGTTMTPDGNTLGGTGGTQTHLLTLGQTPSGITSVGNNTITVDTVVNVPNQVAATTSVQSGAGGVAFNTTPVFGFVVSQRVNTITATSTNTGGTAHLNAQPTILTNCALFAGA